MSVTTEGIKPQPILSMGGDLDANPAWGFIGDRKFGANFVMENTLSGRLTGRTTIGVGLADPDGQMAFEARFHYEMLARLATWKGISPYIKILGVGCHLHARDTNDPQERVKSYFDLSLPGLGIQLDAGTFNVYMDIGLDLTKDQSLPSQWRPNLFGSIGFIVPILP